MILRGFGAWKEFAKYILTLFSIEPLLRTLFVPFHQEGYSEEGARGALLERAVFSILMRIVGAVARLFIIVVGLLALVLSVLLLPVFVAFHLPINTDKLYKHRAFGRDLSFRWTWRLKRAARELSFGQEIHLIGKEHAMAELKQVLSKETQNNALVVGEPGVGKSTLVKQFAKLVSWGRVPGPLRYKHIFELSLEGLAKADVQILFVEAAKAGNVIIVIENIHTYTEVFDAILPFTEVPQLQIIAVTDTEHYHKDIKFRSEFLKSFEKVDVEEPSGEELELYIGAVLSSRKIAFEEGVPREIVRLTNQLIMHVPQPEKSLDIVENLVSIKKKSVTKEDVRELLSSKSGVPVGNLRDNERDTLLNLESSLSRVIIGQDEAVKGIVQSLKRGRSGISSKSRPIGSFLLLGPTGVGKTHTAKKLALAYYGSEESMVRFDMTEFSQEGSADEFARRLVVAVEENPFTLVLFDEVEKASKSVLNLFLQILDEARITDTEGREVNLQNAFIICTSNAGSEWLVRDRNMSRDTFIAQLLDKNLFSPEFLNRFDGAFLYRPFERADAERIAELMVQDFATKMKEDKGIVINYNHDLVVALTNASEGSVFGAREIRRILESTVETYVADQIISGQASAGGTVSIATDLVAKT